MFISSYNRPLDHAVEFVRRYDMGFTPYHAVGMGLKDSLRSSFSEFRQEDSIEENRILLALAAVRMWDDIIKLRRSHLASEDGDKKLAEWLGECLAYRLYSTVDDGSSTIANVGATLKTKRRLYNKCLREYLYNESE